MPISLTTAAAVPSDAEAPDVVAVGIGPDQVADVAATLGVDADLLAAHGFEGRTGQSQLVRGENGLVLVVGLGPPADLDTDGLRRAAAVAARAARRHTTMALRLLDSVPEGVSTAVAGQAVAEGIVLGAYRFDSYRSSQPAAANHLQAVTVVGRGGKRLQAAVDRGSVVAGAVSLARDLVNEPGGHLTAPAFADRAVEVGEQAGLRVTVMDEAAIRKARMGGLLGVNRGSEQPPRFVEVAWEPEKPRGSVALVGKGITFDSGGLSMKTTEGMSTMKDDMGGAAAVLAALSAVPVIAPRLKVTAYLPLTDNMVGPDATRVGDVLTMRNGTTVEVLNTDAEGRLVLADALVKASEDAPDAIIDIATLTGACEVALGSRIGGLMGTHPGLVQQVHDAGDATGEEVWPLPMPPYLVRQMESDIADLRNVSASRYGGTLFAAHFLSRFVGDGIPWAHLDIAGPAWSRDDDAVTGKGGTGFGVRLLLHLLGSWRRP